jgi:hypothetical protein
VTEDIIIDNSEGQLVMMVNDVLFSKESLDDISGHVSKDDEEERLVFGQARSIFTNNNEFMAKMSPENFNLFLNELWYWDNVGSFTVVIIQTQGN